MVPAHLTPADQFAVGPAEALRLPNVGELANKVVSGLEEQWLDALVRIEDQTAAGDITGRRLHPPRGGFVAFPQGYIAPQARAGSDTRQVAKGLA